MEFEKIVKIIGDHLGLDDVSKVKPETSLVKDLEADSLDAVEIIMSIEDEFDVEIPDEDAEQFNNIGDILNYVKAKKE
ncbi:MAG: acyl carrier protein [Alkaliphilus sp.]|nr:MAG: acyl carrier protein [Alkaliphilus sp.]